MKQVVDGNGSVIGSFDGEFVLNGSGSLIYIIDSNEVRLMFSDVMLHSHDDYGRGAKQKLKGSPELSILSLL